VWQLVLGGNTGTALSELETQAFDAQQRNVKSVLAFSRQAIYNTPFFYCPAQRESLDVATAFEFDVIYPWPFKQAINFHKSDGVPQQMC
jgi:hypothetical protein